MKKASKKSSNGLRKEYDLSKLKNGARGKYHSRATEGSNLILVDPDLADLFPDAASVNRALRVVAEAARVMASRRARNR